MSIYTIKRSHGQDSFEVSGPEKEWVETQAEAFAQKFTESTAQTAVNAPAAPFVSAPTAPDKSVKQSLNAGIIGQLVAYVAERQAAFDKTFPNQAAIIAKFLKDNLAIDGIDPDDLAYLYKQVGEWGTVNHLKQLENATTRKKYFTREDGKFVLSYAGEKFAHDTAKEQAK